MGKNSKPILSVLVDEEKKEKFADLARQNKYSMGWLLNDCIDRMLAADSIDIYGEPARSPQLSNTSALPIDTNNIENLVNTYIDKLDIENLVNTSIANLDLKSVIAAQIPQQNSDEDIERMVREQTEPLADLIAELETYTRLQLASMRDELKTKDGQLDLLPKSQIETLAEQPSFVDSTSDKLPKEEREYLTFKQLATELGYPIPEGVVVKSPGKDNADALITFAATLGQSYGWHGKKQKLYRIEV